MQKLTSAIEKHDADAGERPGLSFDRPLHAAMARLTAGLSPAALFQAYTDWAQHLLFSPDKQIELAEEAFHNWMHFFEYCPKALLNPDCEACVELAPNDKRFAGDAWHGWPFNAISQGFLFTQQWWHHATTGVKGVSAHHEDVASFVARQMLDVVSPANFLLTNPEVLEATLQQGGMNLVRGAMNFWEDQRRVLEGQKPVGAEAFQVGRDVAITPGQGRRAQSADGAHSICARDGQGLSRADFDRACLDHEVLHSRSFAGQLARQIPHRPRTHGLHPVVEEPDRTIATSVLTTIVGLA